MTISLKDAGSIYVNEQGNLALCRYATDLYVNKRDII